jgi:hypothetical protein
MTCHELQHFLHDSLPGERASTILVEAREHARTCPACALALDDLLQLETGLTGLSGFEAEEALTQTVLRRIHILGAAPARRRVNRDLLAGALMVAGSLILAIGYAWDANWSEDLARLLSPSLGRSWAVLTVNEGVLQVFLATLVGAALLVMGFRCGSAEASEAG